MATPVRVRRAMPIQGLRTSQPEDTLQELFSPRCLNVRFRFGEVRPRPGSINFTPPPAAEEARFIGEFDRVGSAATGVTTFQRWLLLLLETQLYRFGDTTPGTPRSWFNISGPAITSARRWSTTAGEGFFFFVNGGTIRKWDGDPGSGYVNLVASEGTAPQAQYVEYFNNRLIAAYTAEGGNTFPTRLRWPENGNHLKWDDTLGEGAGFLDIFQLGEEPITAIKILGDRLIVYKDHSIHDVIATGLLAPVHAVQSRVNGIGCSAPYSLASNGLLHFFLAHDSNVYSWDGARLTPIGDPILDELEATVDPAALDTYFGLAAHHRQEYWLVLDADNVFVYDWARGYWTRDTFGNLTALGDVVDVSGSPVWSSIGGLWSTQNSSWEELVGVETPILMGGRSPGDVFKIDETAVDDYFAIGSIVDRFVETPDFYFGDDPFQQGTLKRLLLIYEFVNSEAFEVGVSLDRGQTWNTQSITPTSSGQTFVDLNLTGNVVRFRFRENNATGSFRWRHFTYEFVDAGPLQA